MVKRLTVMFLLLALSGLVLTARSEVEFWSTDTAQLTQWGVNVIPEIRVKNNLSDLYYFQTYIGPVWELNKNLKLNVYYGLKYQKSGSDWKQSNLGYLDLAYSFKPFSNRFRFEVDLTNAVVKYRNQLQLKVNGYYLADEFFYNVSGAFADENRLSAGYTFKALGQTEFNLGYLWRAQRKMVGQAWANSAAAILNTGLKI
ncbi:MAG: DUF2490 domain-containing protein [Candidatus Margulisiibacteriota bacterium]